MLEAERIQRNLSRLQELYPTSASVWKPQIISREMNGWGEIRPNKWIKLQFTISAD